ncbi:hypothetical protein JCGZ_25400 [Jatropha curcas]|uniref:Uncharacterized protein n=1 Tax=Jatropha curcas TaxID=180498 RepID=A0A067JXT1_JATCU|nr:hypothetical protein JCGZ_25400 [Jatropha curcas]
MLKSGSKSLDIDQLRSFGGGKLLTVILALGSRKFHHNSNSMRISSIGHHVVLERTLGSQKPKNQGVGAGHDEDFLESLGISLEEVNVTVDADTHASVTGIYAQDPHIKLDVGESSVAEIPIEIFDHNNPVGSPSYLGYLRHFDMGRSSHVNTQILRLKKRPVFPAAAVVVALKGGGSRM